MIDIYFRNNYIAPISFKVREGRMKNLPISGIDYVENIVVTSLDVFYMEHMPFIYFKKAAQALVDKLKPDQLSHIQWMNEDSIPVYKWMISPYNHFSFNFAIENKINDITSKNKQTKQY